MAVRKWHLSQATGSYPDLCGVLLDLTEEEVLAALALESGTKRRRSFIDRLVSRAVRLNEVKYKAALEMKYGTASPNPTGVNHGKDRNDRS